MSVCLELAKFRAFNDKILMNLDVGVALAGAASTKSLMHHLLCSILLAFQTTSSSAVHWLFFICCSLGLLMLELREPLIKIPLQASGRELERAKPFCSTAEQPDVCLGKGAAPKFGVLWGCRC